MRLVTLGTGTVALTAERVCAGHHVQAGAVSLLLDCGSGITHRLAEHGIAWRSITHVAFTHFHLDHIGDFATLVYAWKYGDLPGRSEPLTVIGPAGTGALLSRLADGVGDWLRQPGFPMHVPEVAPGAPVGLGDGPRIEAAEGPPTDESVAYCVGRGGRRPGVTGGTGHDPMLCGW